MPYDVTVASPPAPTPKRPQSFEEDVDMRRKKYQGVPTSKTEKLAEQVSPETSSTRTPSDSNANPSPPASVSEPTPTEAVEEKPRKRLKRVKTSDIPSLGDTIDTSKAKTTIQTEKPKMSEPPTNEDIPGEVPTEVPGSQSHDVPT